MTRRLLLLALLSFLPPVASAQRIRLSASLSDLEQRARKDSNDAAAHYNVSLAYWNAKRFDDAERSLRLAVLLDPRFAQAYLALSRLPFARRGSLWDDVNDRKVPRDQEATVLESDRYYQRAYLIDPLVDMKIEGAVAPGKSVAWTLFAPELYNLLFKGFDDLREGKYQEAYDRIDLLAGMFRERGERDSVPTGILWYRAIAAAHIEKYNEAQTDLQRLLERSQRRERNDSLVYLPLQTNEYRYVLAYVIQRNGNPNEAIRLYREALENDVGLYMAHVQLANIYEGARMWEQAILSRRNAINANPDDASLLLDLGLTLAKAGKMVDAEEPLRQAQSANPRDARTSYYLGIVEQQLGKKDDARAAFTRFLAIAPSRYDRQIADAQQRLATLQ